MVSRRTLLSLIASAGVAAAAGATAGAAPAKQAHHKNGQALLGGQIKQNGKHEVDRMGKIRVSAETRGGKVIAMTANHSEKGSLPARKVKSRQKFAGIRPGIVLAAADGGPLQLAQDGVYYYAWCFDDGYDQWCYWYPADVVIVDAGWVEYVPY